MGFGKGVFSRSGSPEPLGSGSIRFDLWHLILLVCDIFRLGFSIWMRYGFSARPKGEMVALWASVYKYAWREPLLPTRKLTPVLTGVVRIFRLTTSGIL
jgi:hypothetical protein